MDTKHAAKAADDASARPARISAVHSNLALFMSHKEFRPRMMSVPELRRAESEKMLKARGQRFSLPVTRRVKEAAWNRFKLRAKDSPFPAYFTEIAQQKLEERNLVAAEYKGKMIAQAELEKTIKEEVKQERIREWKASQNSSTQIVKDWAHEDVERAESIERWTATTTNKKKKKKKKRNKKNEEDNDAKGQDVISIELPKHEKPKERMPEQEEIHLKIPKQQARRENYAAAETRLDDTKAEVVAVSEAVRVRGRGPQVIAKISNVIISTAECDDGTLDLEEPERTIIFHPEHDEGEYDDEDSINELFPVVHTVVAEDEVKHLDEGLQDTLSNIEQFMEEERIREEQQKAALAAKIRERERPINRLDRLLNEQLKINDAG